MNGTDEKSKRYSRPFYARSSCLSAILLVFLACFGATTTTITIVRNEDVKGTWVADFCRIVAVALNRPKDACSDFSTVSNSNLTLVALQATQTKLANPVASNTPLPTIDTSASQTLQAIQATQTAMSLRPTATPTTDTSMTQTLAAIAATQTAMSVRPTVTQTMDTSVTQTLAAIAATQTAMSVRPTTTPTDVLTTNLTVLQPTQIPVVEPTDGGCVCALNTRQDCFSKTVRKNDSVPAGSLLKVSSEGSLFIYSKPSSAGGNGNLFMYATNDWGCLNAQVQFFSSVRKLYCDGSLSSNTSQCS